MLKSLNIKNIIKDSFLYELSQSFYRDNFVTDIEVNYTNNRYSVEASLDIFSTLQKISFTLDNHFNLLDVHTSHLEYIGAVLFVLKNASITTYPFIYKNDLLDNLKKLRREKVIEKINDNLTHYTKHSEYFLLKAKDKYQSHITTSLKNEKYDIETIFQMPIYNEMLPSISFKIGQQKKYVIKNIYEFLNICDSQSNHKYGKTLEFIHSQNNFTDEALNIIRMLKKLDQIYYNSQANSSYYIPVKHYKKDIQINELNIDDIFDYYENYINDVLEFQTKDTPIHIKINEGVFAYRILLEDTNILLGNRYVYNTELKENKFVIARYISDEYSMLREFINQFSHNELFVSKEKFTQFYRYVIAPLKPYLHITNDIEQYDNQYNMINIYGDINEDSQVYFQIYYINEDQGRIKAFNPDIYTTVNQDIVENYFESQCDYIKDHIAYFDMNNDKTLEFLLNGLEFLSNYAQIFVSESLKKIGKETRYTINAGVRISNDLLSIDIESDQIPKSEIGNVLDNYRRKKKYYRLKNGEVIFLNSPELEELDQLAMQYHFDLKNMKNGHVELNKNKALSIDRTDFKYIQLNRNKTFTQLIDNFENNKSKSFKINDEYNTVLRDYQKEGLKWLNTLNEYGFNGILADDMGLGKTLQVISLLEHIPSDKPSLVVAPASLIYNWEDEVHKFSKKLKVKCITGNKEVRQSIISEFNNYNIFITSYDYIRRDIDMYANLLFNYVILDEAQNIKNANTINAKSVKQLKSDHKLALTGTPIENTLAELWSIFDFLMPDYLYNYHYFRGYFENDIVKNNDENKIKQLQQMVTPFILRRNKKDVLTELPEKVERTQFIPFNSEESKIYYASLASANEELQNILHMENVNKVQILALLTKLRQLCCEPRMVYENIENPSSKLNSAIDLITNFNNNNQQVLLFSSFVQSLDLIAQELSLNHISYEMLTGSTPKEKRKQLVEQFQNKEFCVFLISLKAGGTGLNLTSAEAVIHFDPWWNISAQNQATDRAYRIGQHNNVQVYKLVMKDSIEEKIIQLQQKKKDLSDMFVENNEGSISQMTTEEIRSLFSM